MKPKMAGDREAERSICPKMADSAPGFLECLKRLSALTVIGWLFAASSASGGAQQNYCLDAASGKQVRAGATLKQGGQALRCCRMAPISGVPSNATFLTEAQFKKVLNPHRCWSGGLRTRDFVAAKIPNHPRRGRRLGR